MTFSLHPTLEKDLVFIKSLGLSNLYLLPDGTHPWAVLIPRVSKEDGSYVKEIHELSEKDQITLIKEIATVSSFTETHFKTDKINVGALGNMVPQLHVHVIGDFREIEAGRVLSGVALWIQIRKRSKQ